MHISYAYDPTKASRCITAEPWTSDVGRHGCSLNFARGESECARLPLFSTEGIKYLISGTVLPGITEFSNSYYLSGLLS
eukprot:scaffold8396_cov46-Cyclotella_meneghiniana.AAC.1